MDKFSTYPASHTRKLTICRAIFITIVAIIAVEIIYGILSSIIYHTITLPRANKFFEEFLGKCASYPEAACVAPKAPILEYHLLTNFVAFLILPFITWFLMWRKLRNRIKR